MQDGEQQDEPLDRPEFDKAPFVRKHLDTTSDNVTIRLNAQEREKIRQLKLALNIDADSTAIKAGIDCLLDVVQQPFWKEWMPYFASQRRTRPGPR